MLELIELPGAVPWGGVWCLFSLRLSGPGNCSLTLTGTSRVARLSAGAPALSPLTPGSLDLQLAEIHGVPRGLYDGPVHEVMVPSKPGGGSQARASCPGKISVTPVRNLHQSGFSLSGELSLCLWVKAMALRGAGGVRPTWTPLPP